MTVEWNSLESIHKSLIKNKNKNRENVFTLSNRLIIPNCHMWSNFQAPIGPTTRPDNSSNAKTLSW